MTSLTEYSTNVLTAGTRNGLRHQAAPDVFRPDRHNPWGVIAPWNNLVAEVYVRNSDPTQAGDSRSLVQNDDFPRQLLRDGYAVRVNDEQGTSGAHIASVDPRKNRKIMQGILARIIAGDSHRIAVLELSRLSRDETRADPTYIRAVVRKHCDGQIVTQRRTYNLFDVTDSRSYDMDTMVAGWRRQDDARNAMDGYRRYIEDVTSGKREITMPHRLSFAYLRIPLVDANGQVRTNSAGKIQTKIGLDPAADDSMRAFRRAANVHADASRVAQELNAALLPGPDKHRPLGRQWNRAAIRRLIRQDIYAGIWTPMREVHSDEITTYLMRQGFDPRAQTRTEPSLAWFTLAEMENWRAKFTLKSITRQRTYDHPLLGLLACARCSDLAGVTVYLTRGGRHWTGSTNREQNTYVCPNNKYATCAYSVMQHNAYAALARQLPAIKFQTTDIITKVAAWAAGGNVLRIQQAIRAKDDRRTWIEQNLIKPCQDAGVRVDTGHVIEHAQLGEQIDNLRRDLDGLDAQTEALQRATSVLTTLGGNLETAIPLLTDQGQAIVYGALLTAAYLAGTGKGRGKLNTVTRFTTVAESRVYSQDKNNQAVTPHLRVSAGTIAWLADLDAILGPTAA